LATRLILGQPNQGSPKMNDDDLKSGRFLSVLFVWLLFYAIAVAGALFSVPHGVQTAEVGPATTGSTPISPRPDMKH